MKTFLVSLACAASLTASVARASDTAARDMLIGGVAGALIGENNHHRAAEGAIIGAAAGLLWNAATSDNDCNTRRVEYRAPVYSEPCYAGSEVIVVDRFGRRHHRPSTYVRVDSGCYAPVVVERRVVVAAPAYRVDRSCEARPAVSHRRVICVREPGCAPRYVEVNE